MRVKQYRFNAAATGFTPWHALDWRQNPFSVSFLVDIGAGSGTYTVEYGYCDMIPRQFNITQSLTVATVKWANHGLDTGDSIIVSGTGTTLDGTYTIASVVDANNITYTATDSATRDVMGTVLGVRVMPHDSVAAATASADGNLAFGVQFVRMRVTVAGSGYFTFIVTQGSN